MTVKTWILAISFYSTWLSCERKMLNEVIFKMCFVWVKILLTHTELIFWEQSWCPLLALSTTLPATFSPNLIPSSLLCPGLSVWGLPETLWERRSYVAMFTKQNRGSIWDRINFQGTASALGVLNRCLRSEPREQSLLMRWGPPAPWRWMEFSRLFSQGRALPLAAVALIEKVCGLPELTSTKWHWSLKNVLQHSPRGTCLFRDFAPA